MDIIEPLTIYDSTEQWFLQFLHVLEQISPKICDNTTHWRQVTVIGNKTMESEKELMAKHLEYFSQVLLVIQTYEELFSSDKTLSF
jgi:hypothetical protein